MNAEITSVNSMAGAVAATVLSAGRWYRRFDWTTTHDEQHVARTPDGWNLALYRYRAQGKAKPFPVICGHGMAGTHLIFDLHPDYSLARYLAARGFDTWLVDLRGRGESWPDSGPRRQLRWSFDDFAEVDLPAAIGRVCELSGTGQAFWLGNDGMVPGVTAAPQASFRGRVPFRTGSRLAGPILSYGRSSRLESSFRSCNVDPVVPARYFRNGIPDEATDLVEQFKSWITEGCMRNRTGSVVYSDRLGKVQLPLLLVAAAADLQRPPECVSETFDRLGSADKTFVQAGVSGGFSVDFGHDDLLAGKASPEEVFPIVGDWLEERSRSSR